MTAMTADALEIRQLIDNWVLWRDAGFWDRFATVWHDDGWMTATWFQGPASRFIDVSRDGFERGVNILHAQGAHTSDIAGTRAIAQTKMAILQRAQVDGVLVDVVVTGRFYDFLEKRPSTPLGTGPSTAPGTGARWGIVRRQPIYEKDRLDPIDPAATLTLDPQRLAQFPEGYRHLAYLQSKIGFDVKKNLPGLKGAAVEKLYAEGAAWLAGAPTPGEPL
jgi:hypothetical protein